MKTTSKKIVGGLVVVLIITTIGVIIVNAQNNDTNSDDSYQKPFMFNRQMCRDEPSRSNETKLGPFCYNLTEEQQTELKDLIENLKESGANFSEIRKAIQDKLDEFGVFDEQLNNAINETEKRLEILNREKELRDQGYSWEEINQMIQDEFGINAPIGEDHGMMFRYGSHGPKVENGYGGCFKK